MSLTSIQKEIDHLSSTERAMLIDILWESLDEARVKEIEAKWAAESEERIDAVDEIHSQIAANLLHPHHGVVEIARDLDRERPIIERL